MKKILIFLGPPGSGKGTQAKKIAAKYNYGHLSTGDLLRALKASGSAAPDEAEALREMEQGKLVPDWLIYRLAFKAIEQNLSEGRGVVLDGAIRNVAQAKEYQKFFVEKGIAADVVAIEITMPDKESLNRLTSRRICSRCGEIVPAGTSAAYSVCPKCSGELVIRADDTVEVIKKRIQEQGNAAIEPVRIYYRDLGILKTVDGMNAIDAVEKNIEETLSVS